MRRRWAGPAIATCLAAALAASTSSPADPFSPAALDASVRAYDAFGVKRTGAGGERATVRWIARRLRDGGFDVHTPAYAHPKVRIGASELQVGGRRIERLPLFPPTFTQPPRDHRAAGGVDGPRAACGRGGPDRTSTAAEPAALLRAPLVQGCGPGPGGIGELAGLVVVTRNPTGELVALNDDPGTPPPPLPVLLVAGREAEPLDAAAADGTAKRLTLTGLVDRSAHASDVVAIRRRGLHWIVVSTPVSGWFNASAEREPGVAILLALARCMSAIAPCDSVALVATTGHEGGYGGIAGALDSGLLPGPDAVSLWVHLGAGLAAWGDVAGTLPETARYLLASASSADAARTAFQGVQGYDTPIVVTAATAVGESETVLRRGHQRVVAGVSAHLYHHTRLDRADRTAGRLIEPVGRAFERMVAAAATRYCGRR